MSHEIAPSQLDTRQLDRTTTARVLTRAVQTGASIELCVLGDPLQISCPAALAGETGEHLILNLLGSEAATRAVTQAASLHATLAADGRWYSFETRRADGCEGDGAPAMTILKPVAMAVADRRRSPRRRLRGAASVSLETSREAGAWRGQAALLNLSTEGLACRVTRDDAEALTPGQAVRVTFRVLDVSGSFELTARVTNVTQGASSGCVVGLEFVDDERLAVCRTRLRAISETNG